MAAQPAPPANEVGFGSPPHGQSLDPHHHAAALACGNSCGAATTGRAVLSNQAVNCDGFSLSEFGQEWPRRDRSEEPTPRPPETPSSASKRRLRKATTRSWQGFRSVRCRTKNSSGDRDRSWHGKAAGT